MDNIDVKNFVWSKNQRYVSSQTFVTLDAASKRLQLNALTDQFPPGTRINLGHNSEKTMIAIEKNPDGQYVSASHMLAQHSRCYVNCTSFIAALGLSRSHRYILVKNDETTYLFRDGGPVPARQKPDKP